MSDFDFKYLCSVLRPPIHTHTHLICTYCFGILICILSFFHLIHIYYLFLNSYFLTLILSARWLHRCHPPLACTGSQRLWHGALPYHYLVLTQVLLASRGGLILGVRFAGSHQPLAISISVFIFLCVRVCDFRIFPASLSPKQTILK